MRIKMYLCILIGLGLIGCKKELKDESFKKITIGEKLAAIIPPVINPAKRINDTKVKCVNATEVSFDTVYFDGKVGTGVAADYDTTDTIAGLNLGYMNRSSAVMRYNFIKGNSYTISVPVTYHGKDVSGMFSMKSESYMPSFDIFTLKHVSSLDICTTDLKSLRGPDDITVGSSFVAGANIPSKATLTHLLTFTANECFEFIGFNFANYSSDHSKKIYLGEIKISPTPLLQFNGESRMCEGETQTLSYGASGFTISDPVHWHVTGDLQIVGSSYGSTVDIKAIGPAGGTVGMNSCNNIVSEANIKFNITVGTEFNAFINGSFNLPFGEYRDYTVSLPPGVTDTKWTVTYYPNVVLTKLSNNKARLSTVGNAPFGSIYDLTLSVRGIGTCGISPNEITKNVRFTYDREPRID